MNKVTYITVMLSLASIATAQAQTPYISIYSGYSMGINKTSFLENYSESYNDNMDNGSETFSFLDYSLGQGLNLGGTIGYMVNDKLGFEIGVNYTKSKSFEGFYKYDEIGFGYRDYLEEIMGIEGTMTRITPTVIYKLNSKKVSPYVKFGLALGLGTITTTETYAAEITVGSMSEKYTSTWMQKSSGGISLGFNSAIGITIPVSKNISLFGEASLTNMSFAPNESEVTEYTEDGIDILNDMSTYEKNTKYEDKFTSGGGNSVFDENVARTELKQPFAFSNLAFNIGITLSLGK